MADSPGQDYNYVPQDQGLAADVSCAFDRITADEPESTPSDRQVGLTKGFMAQEGLLAAVIKVIGGFLRGRQTCRGRSVIGND